MPVYSGSYWFTLKREEQSGLCFQYMQPSRLSTCFAAIGSYVAINLHAVLLQGMEVWSEEDRGSW